MRVLNRKLWIGLPIFVIITLVTGAIVIGGIEGAFVSLGALVLIGMAGFSIYTLKKALRYSSSQLRGWRSAYRVASSVSLTGDDLRDVFYNKPAQEKPITEEDKRIIMESIDELFAKGKEQSREKPVRVEPISKEDKRIIMESIDELFAIGRERSEETSS